jgi:hypothetical protein
MQFTRKVDSENNGPGSNFSVIPMDVRDCITYNYLHNTMYAKSLTFNLEDEFTMFFLDVIIHLKTIKYQRQCAKI